MSRPIIPLSPRSVALLALLLLLGFLGNFWSLPLFFGVDFILGSIAVLIVVYLFGVSLGVLAAVLAGSYTYFLWGHPYALIIFTLEALFVGLSLHKGRRSLLLLDSFYWLVIGMPAVWCFYGLVMHMDEVSTLLIMLKQGINGIFNALLASLAISFLPLRKILDPGHGCQTVSLRETLFDLLVALILGPALFIMILSSRGAMQEMQAETIRQMERVSEDVAGQLTIWYQSNLKAVTELAALAARSPLKPSPALQHDTEIIQKAFLGFHNMYVADSQATTVAFSPQVNEKGQGTIGLNFADRPYFRELQATRQPVLSEVFRGRGGVFSPIVSLSVPILKGDRFEGFALGSFKLEHIQAMLEPFGKVRHLSFTLIDSQGRVITSTVPDRKPMMDWKRSEVTTLKHIQNSVYHWFPDDAKLPKMTRWKNSFYVQETTVVNLPWKLMVEAPVAPLQRRLYTTYVRSLGIIVGMVALALIIALIFSRWLVRPLAGLAQVTSNLPDKLLQHQDITWPESSAAEMHSLVTNFQDMARTLEKNVQELQTGSAQLARLNEGLEGEIAERVRMEEALRRSETLLRNIFESIPDLLTVQDRDFNIIMSNWHGLGESVPEAERSRPHKCYQIYQHRDRPCEPCQALEVLATGQPERLEKFNPVDNSFREIMAYPVRDQSGQVIMVAEYVRDITHRRQMEEALRESEQRFRDISENAAEWIWEMDAEGNFTYASPATEKVLGYKPKELLDKYFYDFYLPEERDQLRQAAFTRILAQQPFRDLVLRHLHKNGEVVWLSVSGVPILEDQGKLRGYRGSGIDITERRRWEESLEDANKQLQILVQDAEERNRQMALLNEMSDVLQSCLTFEEALEALSYHVPKFFPTDAGALYLAKDAKNLLTPVTSWGQPPPTEEEFPPDDCWAIRSGRSYQVADPAAGILCRHISEADSPATGYLCVPLMAQGESRGILHVRFLSCATQGREAKQRLAVAIAENLALSLANLKLRETLPAGMAAKSSA